MAQFHTLRKHFIHYHVPFNKVAKHSSCQTTSIHCAQFLETTQKYKKHQCKQHYLTGKQHFSVSALFTHSVSRLYLTNTMWDTLSVYHSVSPTVYTCKAAGTVSPVLAEIPASYGEAHRMLYQVG